MAVFREQCSPHLYVPIFDSGELPVQVCPGWVAFGPSQFPVQEGGVSLVLEMVEPGGWGGSGSGWHVTT
jgi:hypothetical protein